MSAVQNTTATTPATPEVTETAPVPAGVYHAVVTRVGKHPLLRVVGSNQECRFAYRNVKKWPGEAKFVVKVGDKVTCRLTADKVPKAVSLRLLNPTPAEPVEKVEKEEKKAPAVEGLETISSAESSEGDKALDMESPLTLAGTDYTMANSCNTTRRYVRMGSACSMSSAVSTVHFTHDPYSSTCSRRHVVVTPEQSMFTMDDAWSRASPLGSPVAAPSSPGATRREMLNLVEGMIY